MRGSQRGRLHVVVERHRRELLRLERATASEMVRMYGGIWQRLREAIETLAQQYNTAAAANAEISPSWIHEFNRLYNLQRQTEAEMRHFIDAAEARIVENEREAVAAAGQHFDELMTVSAGPGVVGRWDRLPVEAVSDLVGFTADGSPLRDLLDELGDSASQAVRDGLIEGLAIGQNPREIARRIRKELGGNLTRLLRISRTETLRAYREATRRNYQANDDIIAGWRWLAAKQARTCVMCLAMDGTFHTLDEHLDDHPNGRCAYVPVLRGEEGDGPQWETGAEWLEKSNEDIQRQVLGDAGYEAYKAGAVTLRDYVGQKHDKDWGSTRYARSLREILGKEGAQQWGQIARWEKLPDEKLIPALVRSEIEPTPHLLERVQGYVAGRGFDPQRMQLVDKQVAGHEWKGRLLRENDLLPTLEQHYLKHVVARQEWAEGTTITEYVQTAEDVIRNAESGILAAKVRNRWHMFFVDRVPDVRPHTGSDWVVVQYAVSEGYWWSAYRLWRGVEQLTGLAEREGNRWLRLLPKRES